MSVLSALKMILFAVQVPWWDHEDNERPNGSAAQRSLLLRTLLRALFLAFKSKLFFVAFQVNTFLLTNFELPQRFQNAITETDAQKQEMDKVEFESQTATTETDAKVQKADNDVLHCFIITIVVVVQVFFHYLACRSRSLLLTPTLPSRISTSKQLYVLICVDTCVLSVCAYCVLIVC